MQQAVGDDRRPSAGLECARAIRRILLTATLLVGASTSELPSDVVRAFTATGDYASRRVAASFDGADLDRVRELARRSLPPGVPVDPGPAIAVLDATPAGRELWFQRFAQVLYPRPALPGAPNAIHASPEVVVIGPDVKDGGFAPPADESLDVDWLPVCMTLLGLLGAGAGARWLSRDELPGIAAAFLRGAVVCGLVASLATWTQVPSFPSWIAVVGLLLLPWVVRREWSRPSSFTGALLMAAVALVLIQPLTLWDGRSIWLFKAKQLHFHGLLPLDELASPALSFSHPDYPLLWPSLLALVGGVSPAWNERMALLSAPVFLAACLTLVVRLGLPILGRSGVAALAGTAVLGAGHLTLGGYADGLLALLLVAGALAVLRPGTSRSAWLLLGAAALTKSEGVLFAAVIAGLGFWRGALGTAGWWLVVPALAQIGYSRMLGLANDFAGLDVPLALGDLGRRAGVVAGTLGELLWTGGYHRTHGAVVVGLVAWPASLGFSILGGKKDAATLWLAASLSFAAVASMFLLSPLDLRFHVATAADRLLLTPSLLAIAAVFAGLRGHAPPPAEAAELSAEPARAGSPGI